MPKIIQMNEVHITPERFLDACTPTELNELDMLLNMPRYYEKMHGTASNPVAPEEGTDEAWRQLALMRLNFRDDG